MIGPAYEAWKKGQELPVEGTPLQAWSAVTPEQVQMFKAMGIHTVEEVRDMSENALQGLRFPNARDMPKLAHDFLESGDLTARDKRIADLEKQIEAMAEMMDAKPKTKRGPGRPRKDETEAA